MRALNNDEAILSSFMVRNLWTTSMTRWLKMDGLFKWRVFQPMVDGQFVKKDITVRTLAIYL